MLPQRQALENLNPAFKDMANGDMQLEYDLKAMYAMMYGRKQHLFSNDKRFIIDYSLGKNDEGFFLQVASRPLKPLNQGRNLQGRTVGLRAIA